jgi:hypothetical protein
MMSAGMGANESVEAGGRGLQRVHVVTCAECGTLSGLRWAGWRAYRVDDPDTNEPPALALYCPACAEQEFGHSRRVQR